VLTVVGIGAALHQQLGDEDARLLVRHRVLVAGGNLVEATV
jgi:hypothetical protein